MGFGTARGGHLFCNQNISSVRIRDCPLWRYLLNGIGSQTFNLEDVSSSLTNATNILSRLVEGVVCKTTVVSSILTKMSNIGGVMKVKFEVRILLDDVEVLKEEITVENSETDVVKAGIKSAVGVYHSKCNVKLEQILDEYTPVP